MIKINDHKIFKDNMSTLKETSKYNHNDNSLYYMTNSFLDAVDFDAVKDSYISNLGLCNKPKSNDALVIEADGKSTFIEFKNIHISKREEFDLRKKIYDSMFIFTDIIGQGISYTRRQTDYILVYNKEKNNPTEDKKTNVQVSKSRDQIAKGLISLGNKKYIKFGLEIFENYCFKNVYTYTREEFNIFLESKNRTIICNKYKGKTTQ